LDDLRKGYDAAAGEREAPDVQPWRLSERQGFLERPRAEGARSQLIGAGYRLLQPRDAIEGDDQPDASVLVEREEGLRHKRGSRPSFQRVSERKRAKPN
jgi:hypothetical protein